VPGLPQDGPGCGSARGWLGGGGWLLGVGGRPTHSTKLLLSLQTALSAVSCPSPFSEKESAESPGRCACPAKRERQTQVRGQLIQVCCGESA